MCEYSGGKPRMRNESEESLDGDFRWEGFEPAPSTDHDPLEKGLSLSIDVGTRKMVNYA